VVHKPRRQLINTSVPVAKEEKTSSILRGEERENSNEISPYTRGSSYVMPSAGLQNYNVQPQYLTQYG
jgi:hypothetical protein